MSNVRDEAWRQQFFANGGSASTISTNARIASSALRGRLRRVTKSHRGAADPVLPGVCTHGHALRSGASDFRDRTSRSTAWNSVDRVSLFGFGMILRESSHGRPGHAATHWFAGGSVQIGPPRCGSRAVRRLTSAPRWLGGPRVGRALFPSHQPLVVHEFEPTFCRRIRN